MGLPTRLHGDPVADSSGAMKSHCPRCNSMRKWKIKEENGKVFKICEVCGLKVETKGPKQQNGKS